MFLVLFCCIFFVFIHYMFVFLYTWLRGEFPITERTTTIKSASKYYCLYSLLFYLYLPCSLDETPDLSNLLFLCHWLELWLSRAACRLTDGAAISMRWDQSGSHNVLLVTALCRTPLSSLENNDGCHQPSLHWQANRYADGNDSSILACKDILFHFKWMGKKAKTFDWCCICWALFW